MQEMRTADKLSTADLPEDGAEPVAVPFQYPRVSACALPARIGLFHKMLVDRRYLNAGATI